MEILGNENSITAVSKREKVAYQTLRKWIEQFKETGLSAEEDDIIRLKKENAQLKSALGEVVLENRILKKTEEILGQLQKKGAS
mgnify:CR=1 FL=1